MNIGGSYIIFYILVLDFPITWNRAILLPAKVWRSGPLTQVERIHWTCQCLVERSFCAFALFAVIHKDAVFNFCDSFVRLEIVNDFALRRLLWLSYSVSHCTGQASLGGVLLPHFVVNTNLIYRGNEPGLFCFDAHVSGASFGSDCTLGTVAFHTISVLDFPVCLSLVIERHRLFLFKKRLIARTHSCIVLQAFSTLWSELLARLLRGVLLCHSDKSRPLSRLLVDCAHPLWWVFVRQGQEVRPVTNQIIVAADV